MGLEILWVGLGDNKWSQGACWVMFRHSGWDLERLGANQESGGWGLTSGWSQSDGLIKPEMSHLAPDLRLTEVGPELN